MGLKYTVDSESNVCDEMLCALRGDDALTVDWQCWPAGDGSYNFDTSESAGPAGKSVIHNTMSFFFRNGCQDLGC